MTTEVKVKERPILFSGDMVRAILDGRKTQTRRVVNPQPNHMPILAEAGLTFGADPEKDGSEWVDADCIHGGIPIIPKYGVPGERLWVKETFYHQPDFHGVDTTWYRSDHDTFPGMWTPSIFMRRAYSRITLEIESVKIERLKDITEEDAKAEGALRSVHGGYRDGNYRQGYKTLWESINGAGAWELNPWVWVITFNRTNQ